MVLPLGLDKPERSARSRMRRVDYLLGGKGEKTILGEHTMLTTTPDPRAGTDHPPLALPRLSVMNGMRTLKWNVRDIRTELCLKTEQVLIRQLSSSRLLVHLLQPGVPVQ